MKVDGLVFLVVEPRDFTLFIRDTEQKSRITIRHRLLLVGTDNNVVTMLLTTRPGWENISKLYNSPSCIYR